MTPKQRFQQAHEENFQREYPSSYPDLYYKPTMPKIATANGLTTFIIKFLLWKGHRATRINSSGRLVDSPQKQPSGVSLQTKKWIPGSTRKGAADVSSTIRGRSVMWEVKVGRDRPSEYQLREQELERKAGGEYFFVHTPEEFFEYYDGLFVS